MTRGKLFAGGPLAAAALLAAGSTGVLAARGGGLGHRAAGANVIAFGTLSSLSGNTAVIAAPGNSSVTVTFASSATYTARSLAAATAGLATGDQVAVSGRSVNGTATGSALQFDTTAFPATATRYTGTISAVSATSLTIAAASGNSVTAQLHGSTRYGGSLAANGAAGLASGNTVRVVVAQYTDGSLVVQSIAPATAKAAGSTSGTTSATATASPTATATSTP